MPTTDTRAEDAHFLEYRSQGGRRRSIGIARLAMALASPAGNRARLSVLIYHRVRREVDPLFPGEVDAVRFDQHLELLSRLFNVLPLQDAVRLLAAGKLPARAACITFDDGYADNADVALPILQRHGMTATFFICTGFLDGGRMWNDTIIESIRRAEGERLDLAAVGLGEFAIATNDDRQRAISQLIASAKYLDPARRVEHSEAIRELSRAALPDDLMLRTDQVRALHDAGMGIGGHTVNHPILLRLPADLVRREIADGKSALEQMIGAPVRLFAYPNGTPGTDYDHEHAKTVCALGFDAAFSTAWGAASRSSDPFQLPRFTPWDRTSARMSIRFLRNLRTPVSVA